MKTEEHTHTTHQWFDDIWSQGKLEVANQISDRWGDFLFL